MYAEGMRRRVVITGLGMVTPLGNDVPTLWYGLLAGRGGVDPITRFDPTGLEVRIAAGVIQRGAANISERRSLYSTV